MPYRDPSDPKCPACGKALTEDDEQRCSHCGYGLRPAPYENRPPPKQLFGPTPQENRARRQLEASFRCPYCGSFGAAVDEIWFAPDKRGTGYNEPLLTARCLHCAAVQMFSPEHFDPATPIPGDGRASS